MPDNLGRLTLGEIRVGVWRQLSALYPDSINTSSSVVDATGKPTPELDPAFGQSVIPILLDPLFPREDVDRALNSSLTAHYLILVENAETIFSDSELIDVQKDIAAYPLPADLAFLRGLWYLSDTSKSVSLQPSSKRIMMHMLDEESNEQTRAISNNVPHYRRQMGYVVLDPVPRKDVVGAIECRYVKWIHPILDDVDIIESEYAQVLQEVIILDAAIMLAERKGRSDVTTMRADLAMWETRLDRAAGMSNRSPFKVMTFDHPIKWEW